MFNGALKKIWANISFEAGDNCFKFDFNSFFNRDLISSSDGLSSLADGLLLIILSDSGVKTTPEKCVELKRVTYGPL